MNNKEQAALLSVASNTTLVILKIAVGLYTGAMSVLSEGIHSSIDLMASAVQYIAIKKGEKPPDKEHSYGHGKFENVSAGTESLLIIMVGFMLFIHALEATEHEKMPDSVAIGVVIMIISIVVNLLVSSHMIKVAKKTASLALEADALHLRSDIWSSVGVLIGLILINITGFMWLDSVIALFVACIIIRAGVKLARQAFLELTDAALPDEQIVKIENIIREIPEVQGLHAMRTRQSGAVKMLDVHVLFDGSMHLSRVHAVCDEIEERLHQNGFGTLDITIHPEPTTSA